MGFFSKLFGFGKNTIDSDYMTTSSLIPIYYSAFPIYQKKIVQPPEEKVTEKYNRLEIYYPGKPLSEYKELLKQNGFVQETDVRFNKGSNCYVIVEKCKKSTKIAYHISR